MPSIFLSYARDDDEPFVRRLHCSLVARGFSVWFDRTDMPSRSLTFHQEIIDAITLRDRLVLVVGPRAIASDYVRQEWQHAYFRADKVVTPILRLGDFSLLPEEIRLLHCEDFRDDAQYAASLENLVRQLSEAPPPLGRLFDVPSFPLTKHFMPREGQLARLRQAVRADLDAPTVITRDAARIGLCGMGGLGKSVLAAALARDRKIREAFPDGIAWITLGETAPLLNLQRSLYQDLGGRGTIRQLHESRLRLRDLLADKRVLLILDDAWNRRDVEAFDVLGPRCRALITTRDGGLLKSLGCVQCDLDLLTDLEAANILARSAELDADRLPPEANHLIRACGHLPLALALCGGMIRGGITWSNVLEQFEHARIDRIADRHAIDPRHASIWHAIHASVQAMPVDDQERFLELAVFPRDDAIPEAAVATLWAYTGKLDEFATRQLIVILAERSLLLYGTQPECRSIPGEQSASLLPQRKLAACPTIRLHDLMCDYLQQSAFDLQALHGKLLDAFRSRHGDDWSKAPDDGYIRAHFPFHMAEAERWDHVLSVLDQGSLGLLTRWTDGAEFRDGLKCLQGVIGHLRRTGRDPNQAAGLATQVARILSLQCQYAEAESWLQNALTWSPWWGGRRVRAVALHELGSLSLNRGNIDEAEERYRRALRQCWLGWPTFADEAAANQLALAKVWRARGRAATALPYAQKALGGARKSRDYPHVASALQTLAVLSRDLNKLAQAETYLKEAAQVVHSAQLPLEAIAVDITRGWLDYAYAVLQGVPITAASQAFQRAHLQARHLAHRFYHAEALLGLARCAVFQFAADDAQAPLAEVDRDCGDELDCNLDARRQLLHAAVMHQHSDLSNARSMYEQTIAFCQKHQVLQDEATAWVGLGASHWHMHSLAEAETAWQKARQSASRLAPLYLRLVDLSIDAVRIDPRRTPY